MPATSASLSAVLRAATDAELPAGQLSTTESITLVQALGAVPDPRHRRGRRHSLQSVLLLALAATAEPPTRGWTVLVSKITVYDTPKRYQLSAVVLPGRNVSKLVS